MTDALARAKPQIDDPQELDRVVRRLVEQLDPVAVYLFGSRGRGDSWRDSDYDLMVVLRNQCSENASATPRFRLGAQSERIDANVFLSQESAYAWRRHEVGTLEYEAEIDGVELYPNFGRRSREADQLEIFGTANVAVVSEWLDEVQRDLFGARSCAHGKWAVLDRAAFHVQQAAEKLAKAALVAHRIRPERRHDIGDAVEQLPDGFTLKGRFLALHRFTDYAVVFRYPGAPRPAIPSSAEVDAWVEEIGVLKRDFERWLKDETGGQKKRRAR
jgi:predicted nucleotidyltransferase/HEPN domain-containing protein